jgi:hypothetical protein
MVNKKEAPMPASHRPALLALAAALALCACNTSASPQSSSAQNTSGQNTSSQSAGAQTSGSQPLSCAGPSDTACGPEAYCKADAQAATAGRCAPKPQACPMIFHPVCGADGRTYPNSCHAERAGVNLAHSGACEK